jgi:hypothetical protein
VYNYIGANDLIRQIFNIPRLGGYHRSIRLGLSEPFHRAIFSETITPNTILLNVIVWTSLYEQISNATNPLHKKARKCILTIYVSRNRDRSC